MQNLGKSLSPRHSQDSHVAVDGCGWLWHGCGVAVAWLWRGCGRVWMAVASVARRHMVVEHGSGGCELTAITAITAIAAMAAMAAMRATTSTWLWPQPHDCGHGHGHGHMAVATATGNM